LNFKVITKLICPLQNLVIIGFKYFQQHKCIVKSILMTKHYCMAELTGSNQKYINNEGSG